MAHLLLHAAMLATAMIHSALHCLPYAHNTLMQRKACHTASAGVLHGASHVVPACRLSRSKPYPPAAPHAGPGT